MKKKAIYIVPVLILVAVLSGAAFYFVTSNSKKQLSLPEGYDEYFKDGINGWRSEIIEDGNPYIKREIGNIREMDLDAYCEEQYQDELFCNFAEEAYMINLVKGDEGINVIIMKSDSSRNEEFMKLVNDNPDAKTENTKIFRDSKNEAFVIFADYQEDGKAAEAAEGFEKEVKVKELF